MVGGAVGKETVGLSRVWSKHQTRAVVHLAILAPRSSFNMALQAPERRTTLEEDLARASALSRADKRLGDYFPAVADTSGAWHFDGSEHTGGGFDQDQYAYHDRKSARREWEVSVVQFARERELQDRGWEAEQEWRDIGNVHSMEEAEIERAKRRQEGAWSREQRARREPALKTKLSMHGIIN